MSIITQTTPKPDAALSGADLPWPLHEACAAWPAMSQLDLRDLADDIAAHGLRDRITLTPDGFLLDGRNRALACAMAGVEPATVVYDGDPWLFSLSRNRHRRHLTTDQLALIAARLATRTVGNPNFAIGSREPIGVAEAAKASGVPETAIKSAKVVLKHGSPEEQKAVGLGSAPLRKTADRIRERQRATASPKLQSAKAPPSIDPIDAVACKIISQCSDGKWRSLSKVATTVKFADTAVRQALISLGEDCVAQRKNGSEIEYRIVEDDQASLRRSLAAKDQEIADLKNRIAEQELEIEQLRGRLLLAELSTPPARKQKRAEPESDTAKITVN